MSEATRPVLGASVALFRGGRVLLIRRARAPGLGLYSLPGGRVERGERLHEAASRELFEETGLTGRIIGRLAPLEFIENGEDGRVASHAVVIPFAGLWLAGEPVASDEISDMRWVDPLAPGDWPMTRGLPDILREAQGLAVGGPG